MTVGDATTECRSCHEVNPAGTIACARCGQALLSLEETRKRSESIERGKRQAERESVDYPTTANLIFDRFTGTPVNRGRYFGSLSNYRKRIGLACLSGAVLVAVVLLALASGH